MPSEKDLEQARFFCNRVAKRDRHLGKLARRANSDCYRVYDRDIPEVPLSVDRYGSAAVLYLYERPYEKPEDEERLWLGLMVEAAAAALCIDAASVRVKTRRKLGVDEQYERVRADEKAGIEGTRASRSSESPGFVVRENGLSFMVNLDEYIDTGLFLDHQKARSIVRGMAAGVRVLNLFCYTGSFSVYALAGGASAVVGVDLSRTYLAWAEKNVSINGFDDGRYRGVRADVSVYLADAASRGERFDIVVLDPPTFSNSSKMAGFLDVVRQWPLLVSDAMAVLAPEGTLLFSTNAKSLRMDTALLPGARVRDISDQTIPEGYHGHPHRTWLISPTRSCPRDPA
ncbi:MAG: class I SAM-dependent methyltransferase [Spirochaetales bacterium]|nr:class I SAM-dependent methyltransferase [Spirochaetales bacterium]